MNTNFQKWQKLFLFCCGLSIAAFFCMKWMEGDLWSSGEKFTIIGLELFYPKEKVIAVLSHLDDRVRTILSYHLHFDFVFMAGIYPGISSICMMARERVTSRRMKNTLYILASLQFLAWAGDITENSYLLKWLEHPVIEDDFALYHFIVSAKWIIGLAAFFFSLGVLVSKWRQKRNNLIS